MEFLDDLKKKTEQIASEVSTKTQQGLDTVKLNSAISTEEKKIRDLYTQLGEKYWSLSKDSPLEELSELVNSINTSKQIVEKYRKQIIDIRLAGNTDGIVCRYCGAVNKSDSRFCEKCGKPLSAPEIEVEQEENSGED